MKARWEGIAKSAKLTSKNYKNKTRVIQFFQQWPEKGYMLDEKNKKDESGKKVLDDNGKPVKEYIKVKISDCPDSTLRRFVKTLNTFYYVVPDQPNKDKIVAKKVEIETVLNDRKSDSK